VRHGIEKGGRCGPPFLFIALAAGYWSFCASERPIALKRAFCSALSVP